MLSKAKIVLETFWNHPGNIYLWGHFQRHLGKVARVILNIGSRVLCAGPKKKVSQPSPLCIMTVDIMWLTTSCYPSLPAMMDCVPLNCEPQCTLSSSNPCLPPSLMSGICHSSRRSNSYKGVCSPSWDNRILLDGSWICSPLLTKTLSCGEWLWLYFRLS